MLSTIALLLSLTVVPAYAGSYIVQTTNGSVTGYSGGTASDTGGMADGTSAGYTYSGGAYGGEASNIVSWPIFASGSAQCSGAITVTFVWSPSYSGEQPPQTAIIEEDSTVSYTNDTGLGGQLNDGLGHTSTASSGSGATISNSTYFIKDTPGASFTLPPCSPQASASGATTTASWVPINASVSFKAEAYPVTVDLNGTTKDSSANNALKVLTGQQIIAKLDLNGAPGSIQSNSYSWSTVGSIFKDYNISNSNNDQLVPLSSTSPSDYTNPTLSFYDETGQDAIQATCNATYVDPNGGTHPLSIDSPTATSIKPTVSNWLAYKGIVRYDSTTARFGYWSDSANSFSTQGETWFDMHVTVPSPFSGGTCVNSQLATPNWLWSTGTGTKPAISHNNVVGLDGGFEYGSEWAAGSDHTDGDSPALHPLGTTNSNSYANITTNDSFTTWIMYKPPAVTVGSTTMGTVWVPLNKYDWSWSEEVDWLNNAWQLGVHNPSSTNLNSTDESQKTTDAPPLWNVVHSASDWLP